MQDGLLQLASTIFLTFGLGTLLYALVSYGLKRIAGEAPPASPARPAYPTPQAPVYYGHPYHQGYPQAGAPQAAPPQSYPGYAPPPPAGYPLPGSWPPPGNAPRA